MSMEFAKSKKKRKPLPGYVIFIIVFGFLSIIVGVIRGVLEVQNEKVVEQIMDLKQSESEITSATLTSNVGITPISHKGISFKLPKGWTYEIPEEEDDNPIHMMFLESTNIDTFTILWGSMTDILPANEWIQNVYDTGGEDFSNFSPQEITEFTFCGVPAYNFYFTCKKYGFTYYARCISFTKKEMTFCLINLTDLKSHLTTKFSFFEDTLSL